MASKYLYFNCLIEGESTVFVAAVERNWRVSQLKEAIQAPERRGMPKDIDPEMLELWKVNINFEPRDSVSNFKVEENGEGVEKLTSELIKEYWSDQPMSGLVHIIVKVPATLAGAADNISLSRLPPRCLSQIPHPNISSATSTKMPENEGQVLPELGWDASGLTPNELIENFLQSFRPKIKEYLSRPGSRIWMPPMAVDANVRQFYHNLAIPSINNKPNLLLHNIGNKTNPNGDTLFHGVDHRVLCNTSGAGKTALIFNELCSRWGFYFAAAQDSNQIGVKDMELAIRMMPRSPGWIPKAFENPSSDAIQKSSNINETIAYKWVYKVLLTRWILFHAFVNVAKDQRTGKLPPDFKRKWLLFQILPVVSIDGMHPFLAFMNYCLVGMSVLDLETRLAKFSPESVLGPAFDSESDKFFYILDEAQVAGAKYMGAFADAKGEIHRPVLRPIIKAWNHTAIHSNSIRFIVSGTGFSLDLFQTVSTSGVGKPTPWTVVYQTGDFIDPDLQKSYITHYLPPPFLSSPSGTALVSRMYEWLRGRHRFTSTFIEQLLVGAWTSNGPSSPQKLLNAYVHVFTNFNPIDCDSKLLAIEPDVDSPELDSFAWDKLKRDEKVLNELSTSIYAYMTQGKYPMWYKERQELVEYGVARFKGKGDEVIVEEPMALVGIVRYFEENGLTIEDNIQRRMQTSQGDSLEEAVLLSCTRLFRVGACLSDIFQFYGNVPDWAHQKAWIVSQKGQELVVADIVNGNPVAPSAGVAYYAEHPEDVENWITSKSHVWCIPGRLMGPDLMGWLQLEDGRLILLLIQAKCHLEGNKNTLFARVTPDAIRSLTPCNFYSSLCRRSANGERSRMLAAINTARESFTGARYNVLRVIAAYPLDEQINPERPKAIVNALNEDQHPLATFRHGALLSSFATQDNTHAALSSLAYALKRTREDEETLPNKKPRKKSVNKKRRRAERERRKSSLT